MVESQIASKIDRLLHFFFFGGSLRPANQLAMPPPFELFLELSARFGFRSSSDVVGNIAAMSPGANGGGGGMLIPDGMAMPGGAEVVAVSR